VRNIAVASVKKASELPATVRRLAGVPPRAAGFRLAGCYGSAVSRRSRCGILRSQSVKKASELPATVRRLAGVPPRAAGFRLAGC
jgi:hypothetical protein